MPVVYLALGSNVGDSRGYIEQAIELLSDKVQGIQTAPIYKSKAIGHTGQPNFLNTAIRGQTNLIPGDLLEFVNEVEQKVGRVERFRWGPREIDIDIILYGDFRQETKKLTLPHPHFRERDFVLKPLRDLDGNLIDPISGQTVLQLLDKLDPAKRVILGTVDEKL